MALKQTRKTKTGGRQFTRKRKTTHVTGGKVKRKMNCSPLVKNSTVKNSCYTPSILLQIRDAYNADNTDNKITYDDPDQIWTELNERLNHCDKEDCWLNQLKDATVRKQIDRYVFAPDKPSEWKKNPNEWLSNYDIFNVLEQYEKKYSHFNFIGPTPIDFDKRMGDAKCVWNELCSFSLREQMKQGKRKFGIIFNTDEHTEPGEHWISLFIDMDSKLIYFFDSAGGETPPEVRTFVGRVIEQGNELGKCMNYYRNKSTHQKSTTECGMYSLFFIITMLTHEVNGVYRSKKSLLKLFTSGNIRDTDMEKYRNVYFNEK